MGPISKRQLILLLVAALVLAACGPRRPDVGETATGPDDGGSVTASADGATTEDDGLAGPSEDRSLQAGGSTAQRGGAVSAGRGPAAAGVNAPSAAAAPGVDGPTGQSAPGVTDTEIVVGAEYDRSAGALNAAYGFSGIGQIDQRRAWETLVADVNEHGGVGGRKLKLVFHEWDSTQGKSEETRYQEMCSTFTQDNRVFAVFEGGNDTLKRCLSKAGVAQIGSGGGENLIDSDTLREFPYFVMIGTALDRVVRFGVDGLVGMGYYKEGRETPGYKLGLVRYDEPVFERGSMALKDALAAKGLKLSEEVAVHRAQSEAELSDEFAGIRAAALQMKSNNVTHVQFLGTPQVRLPLFFMQAAEKQLYRARYGLVSTDGGQTLATLLGNDAQPQLSESLLVGWFPLFDVPARDYSGDNTTEAFRRCIETLKRGGETFGDGDPTRNKEALASQACDTINYFKAAAEAAGPVLTPQTWLAGVAKVNGLDSAGTFILTTTDTRRDAVGGVRDDRWFDDCSCFRYTSGVRPV